MMASCATHYAPSSIAPLLWDGCASVRASAVHVLERIRGDAAVDLLCMALRSERDAEVIDAATRTLVSLLKPPYGSPPNKQRVLIQSAALSALERIDPSSHRTVARLAQLLQEHGDRDVVVGLIKFLGGLRNADPRRLVEVRHIKECRGVVLDALNDITGAGLRDGSAAAWADWWNRHGDGPLRTREREYRGPSATAAVRRRDGTFFGVPVTARQVVFVVDASGSMGESALRNPDGRWSSPTRFDIARREVASAIEGLDSNDMFGLVVFSAKARVWRSRLALASPGNREEAIRFLGAFRTGGSTALWDALESGMMITASGGGVEVDPVDELLIVSDGREIQQSETSRNLVNVARRVGLRVRAVAVGRALEGNHLAVLARATGGSFLTFATQ